MRKTDRGLPTKTMENENNLSSWSPMDMEKLIQQARDALKLAIAPSSQFRVGAALVGKSGRIYTGCNIESPVYLGICAERVALFKGLSEGEREFAALAIVCEENVPCTPCGTCRQLLWEFVPSLQIVLMNEQGSPFIQSINDLLPSPFERGDRNPFREGMKPSSKFSR